MVGFAYWAESGNFCDEFVRVVGLRCGAIPDQLLSGCNERLCVRGQRGDGSDYCVEGRNQREEHSSPSFGHGRFRREQLVFGRDFKFWWR
jgi:hypothetical protein